MANIKVESDNVRYYNDVIEADYEYENVRARTEKKTIQVKSLK